MSGVLVLLKIAGFVALLLWGAHMVTSGILRAFGAELRKRIDSALSNKGKTFVAGILVTLALQSSTATGLMASSFAAYGVLSAVPGFILMLGANVGTALVTQLLSFPAIILAAPLFLIGFLLFKNSKAHRWNNVGRALIGVGLMFLSLHELVATFEPLADLPIVKAVLGSLDDQLMLAFLIGVGAAWLCHSSVAVVMLVMSMAAGGVLPIAAGLAMVLGANLGGAIPPAMEAEGSVAKRLPMGNLIVRFVGCVFAMIALPFVATNLEMFRLSEARSLVDAHVAFNVALAIFAFPFASKASKFLTWILPDPPTQNDPSKPIYLDASLNSQPHLALANLEREALRLSDNLVQQLKHSKAAIVDASHDDLERVSLIGDYSTTLGREIRRHILGLKIDNLGAEDQSRAHKIVSFVINMEHAADLLPHNLLEPIMMRNIEGDLLDKKSRDMLDSIMDDLISAVGLSVSVFIWNEKGSANELLSKKQIMRERERRWQQSMTFKKSLPVNVNGRVGVDVMMLALRESRRILGHVTALAEMNNDGDLPHTISGEGS